jgi:hypothetical protein
MSVGRAQKTFETLVTTEIFWLPEIKTNLVNLIS